MLTITTEKSIITVNTDLLKNKLKKAILKALTISKNIIILAGFVYAVYTARKFENDLMSFSQALLNMLYGFLIVGSGYMLNFIKLVIE